MSSTKLYPIILLTLVGLISRVIIGLSSPNDILVIILVAMSNIKQDEFANQLLSTSRAIGNSGLRIDRSFSNTNSSHRNIVGVAQRGHGRIYA